MNDPGSPLHARSMTELAAGLDAGEFSAVELAEALLERIASLDGQLNAFVTVMRHSLQPSEPTRRAPKGRAES